MAIKNLLRFHGDMVLVYSEVNKAVLLYNKPIISLISSARLPLLIAQIIYHCTNVHNLCLVPYFHHVLAINVVLR